MRRRTGGSDDGGRGRGFARIWWPRQLLTFGHTCTKVNLLDNMKSSEGAAMRKILVASCEQEISSFNPRPSRYEDLSIRRGQALFGGTAAANACVGGSLDGMRPRPALYLTPVYGAADCSAAALSGEGFGRLAAGF